MVADQRAEQEAQAEKAAAILGHELDAADVPADIAARANAARSTTRWPSAAASSTRSTT